MEKVQKNNSSTSAVQNTVNKPGAGLANFSAPLANPQIDSLVANSPQLQYSNAIMQMANREANIAPATTHLIQMKYVHKVKKALTPYIYEFTSEAIDKGAPSTLNYLLNKNSEVYVQDDLGNIIHKDYRQVGKNYSPVDLHSINRMKALSKGVELKMLPDDTKIKTSRDEYPYASTMEGGTDSYWANVPVTEQNIQGGQLGALYRKILSEAETTEFDVVLE